MKKNFTLVCMAAAMILGISSCSKDDVSGNTDGPGDVTGNGNGNATVVLNLSFPQTYAADGNATSDETNVKNVDIFIINPETGGIVTHKNLQSTELTDESNNKWSASVKTTSGEKQILVGVNLPNSIRSVIAQNGIKGANNEIVHDIPLGLLSDASAGFAMFSTEVLKQTLHSDDDISGDPLLNNNLSVQVERMVAKVAVQEAATINTTEIVDGDIDFTAGLSFTLGNVNKKMYAMQYKDALGVIRDPNYLSDYYLPANVYPNYGNDSFFNPSEDQAGYINVDANGTTNVAMVAKYAPENVADLALRGTNTYLSVKAYFIPEEFSDENGTTTPNTNLSAVSFWTVTRSGNVVYFDDEDEADKYIVNGGGVKSDEYVGGACYYRSYLSWENGYNLLRNKFYKVTITKINSLGSPDPDDDGEDDEEPIDGDFATIDIDIDIVPWFMIEEDHQLGK